MTDKLILVERYIHRMLESVPFQPCVFFSGGIDSMLVLYLVKELDPEIPVVIFNATFSKEQWSQVEQLILEWDLTLYTLPPAHRFVIPNEGELTLVDEYALSGQILPVLRDVESGTDCVLEMTGVKPQVMQDFPWAYGFTGALRSDTHRSTLGNPMRKKKQGKIRFFHPLWNWTKTEVLSAAYELKLSEISGTGEIKACHNCLTGTGDVFCPADNKMIPSVVWDKDAMLNVFRSKYNYAATNATN